MSGKGTELLLAKLDELQVEQKEIQEQILIEKSGLLDATLPQLRRYVRDFKHKDYTKTANRQALVETFVNKVWLLDDDKAKVRYNVTDFGGSKTGSFYDRMVERHILQVITPIERRYAYLRNARGNGNTF